MRAYDVEKLRRLVFADKCYAEVNQKMLESGIGTDEIDRCLKNKMSRGDFKKYKKYETTKRSELGIGTGRW